MNSKRKESILAVMSEYKIRTAWLTPYLHVGIGSVDSIIFSGKDGFISDYNYTRIAKALNRIVKALGYNKVPLEVIPDMDYLITKMDEYNIPDRVLLRQLRANKYKLHTKYFTQGVYSEEDYAAMITAINQLIEKGGKHYEYY